MMVAPNHMQHLILHQLNSSHGTLYFFEKFVTLAPMIVASPTFFAITGLLVEERVAFGLSSLFGQDQTTPME